MAHPTCKRKGFRGTKGYSKGGQLSRVPKPAKQSGKASPKDFPGAK